MHDWWLASVASVGAKIVYDPVPRISYRQHSANYIGLKAGLRANIEKLHRAIFSKPTLSRFDHAKELDRALGPTFDSRQRKILDSFLRSEGSVLRRAIFAVRYGRSSGFLYAARFVLLG